MNLLLAALLLPAALRASHEVSVGDAPRSAMLIVLDDVSTYDLQLYGGAVGTPSLAALAAQGVVFRSAYANSTCAATRRSLLYGYWWTSDSGEPCSPASPATPLATDSCLARLVPVPSTLVGKWHLGGSPSGASEVVAPLEHGFVRWISGVPANVNSAQCPGQNYNRWPRVEGGVFSVCRTYNPTYMRDRARFWWTAGSSARFFVVSLNLAHGPFHVPPPALLPAGYPTPVSALARYQAMIVALDTIIGQILADVNLETTMVVVVGDNGTPPQVAPDPDKAKDSTFERGIHVPLLIAGGPTVSGGRESEALVHVVDVWSTLLEWLEGSAQNALPARPIRGQSLLPALTDPADTTVYHERVLCGSGPDICARSSRYKLRRVSGVDVGFYDLWLDPAEESNVITEPLHAAEVAAASAWLTAEAP